MGCEFFGCGEEAPEVGLFFIGEAEADDVLHGFEPVAGFCARRFALHGVHEEARDYFTVSGEVANVLLKSGW